MQIRLARADDGERIASVLLEAFREFERLYSPAAFRATTPTGTEIVARLSDGPTWVATDGNTIVGTVSAVRRDNDVYLRSMAVAPAARGHGIARQLLNVVHAYAESQGARRLTLATTPFLDDAIRLYEQSGFRRTDVEIELHGTPLIGMAKPLADDG